jgi:4a-hydroxytetrahydrobiopterin dehydratase|tara:strand:+ start:275 stop:622 length:348 start_codon:yes stop_codon:yes gene_type:complete
MDDQLYKKKCIPCEGNIPAFDIKEIHKYLKKVDGWDVKENQDKSYFLKKNYKFKNFTESQNFVNEVGKIAETESHHPDIHFGWGYAQIIIFTHSIKGLAESDFILASKIDQIKIN